MVERRGFKVSPSEELTWLISMLTPSAVQNVSIVGEQFPMGNCQNHQMFVTLVLQNQSRKSMDRHGNLLRGLVARPSGMPSQMMEV